MFDDALRKLSDLRRRAEALDGKHSVSFPELFNDEFMLRNTDFASISAMFEASGFNVESSADFEAIPEDAWDKFVCDRTRFTEWKDMQAAAGKEWMSKKMGFDEL
jgi:hypothetical protein